MAHFKRHLILHAAVLASCCVSVLAQTEPVAPIMFRTLGIGDNSATAGLLFEDKGRPVDLLVDSHGLSPKYPSPDGGRLALFRELPPAAPGEPPRRLPVAEARLGKTGPTLLALLATPDPANRNRRRVSALAIDDSWEAHPAESVRVFNFSRRLVAIQSGAETTELASGASRIVPYPEKSRVIDLKIAIREKDAWMLCSTSPQGIIPKTRMIIVVADDDPTPDNPAPVEPVINTIYDTSPPPRPAKESTARASAKPARPAA